MISLLRFLLLALPLSQMGTPRTYPLVPLALVAQGKWHRPRAAIVGTVRTIHREADGDVHVDLRGPAGDRVIIEFIPEIRLPSYPKRGQIIRVWGVVREDRFHHWEEVHPAVGWRAEK